MRIIYNEPQKEGNYCAVVIIEIKMDKVEY